MLLAARGGKKKSKGRKGHWAELSITYWNKKGEKLSVALRAEGFR